MTEDELWGEWGRVTRFLECTRIAFRRELSIWEGPEIANATQVRLRTVDGHSQFAVTGEQHIATLQDHELLHFIVLSYSYSLCERFARVSMGKSETDQLSGGIEQWGAQLLSAAGHDWEKVEGGLSAAIEVAVARNFIAHGARVIDHSITERFHRARVDCPWQEGEEMNLDYEQVERYRACLKSLMRHSKRVGIGLQ